MMRTFSIVCFLLLASMVEAQNATATAEKIKSDPAYLFGEGWGETFSTADKGALQDLISKISLNLSSSFTVDEKQINSNRAFEYSSAIQSVVNTYTQASLTNTESVIISNEPDAHILRYIKRSELSRIFQGRKEKVEDCMRSALKAEAKGKIDDALRYYYWGYALVRSLQYPNEVRFNDQGEDHLLINWIPEQMNAIFDHLAVNVTKKVDNEWELLFTYKGEPVASADYTYFNGQTWSSLYSAKDGLGTVDLRPGAIIDNLQLKFEYEYMGESHIDKEIETVMSLFKGTSFRKALFTVGTPKKNRQIVRSLKSEATAGTASVQDASMLSPLDVNKEYVKSVEAVIQAIRNKNYLTVKPLFTSEGMEMFDKLLHYGNARILGAPSYQFFSIGDRIICRSIPMSFSFQNNNRNFVEDVTFTFNAEKQIEAVAFGLGNEAKTDIFNKGGGKWSALSKLILANFLEDYKTAFALKRLDYIKQVFDDDAVIITGHMVKALKQEVETNQYDHNQYVKYTRQSKNDYLRNLQHCFNSNQFINIRFANNDVVKMGAGGEVYGIQIRQDYYSSSYGDTGYLFLLVDLNDPLKPIIKVRTWQPERDPNVNSLLPKNHPDYGIIGPGNF